MHITKSKKRFAPNNMYKRFGNRTIPLRQALTWRLPRGILLRRLAVVGQRSRGKLRRTRQRGISRRPDTKHEFIALLSFKDALAGIRRQEAGWKWNAEAGVSPKSHCASSEFCCKQQ